MSTVKVSPTLTDDKPAKKPRPKDRTLNGTTVISQRELRNNSGEILRRAEAGEVFTVTRYGRPVVSLQEYAENQGLKTAVPETGSLKHLLNIVPVEPSESIQDTIDFLRSEGA